MEQLGDWTPVEIRKPREECGVAGIWVPEEAAISNDLYIALKMLQHRGQEAAGMAVSTGETIITLKNTGLVDDVFTEQKLAGLPNALVGVGHVRYGTSDNEGTTEEDKWQATNPIFKSGAGIDFTFSANGHFVGAPKIAEQLGMDYYSYASDNDFVAAVMAERLEELGDVEKAARDTLELFGDNAFSVCISTKDSLIYARDPRGFRPLWRGTLAGGGCIVASEKGVLETLGAIERSEVAPGEIGVVSKEGHRVDTFTEPEETKVCSFEFIYTSRPDNELLGETVSRVRERMGRALFELYGIDTDTVDLVSDVPESGLFAALGYAKASGVPYEPAFVKNRYIGRTFIHPTQTGRQNGNRIKLNPLKINVDGKRVLLLDDSFIRGHTSRRAVSSLREAGAEEIHFLVTSPQYQYSCYYGMDTDDASLLFSRQNDVQAVAEHLGVESFGFLPEELLRECIGSVAGQMVCDACFTGNYPTDVPAANAPLTNFSSDLFHSRR